MDRGGSGEVGTTQQRDVRVTGAYYRWGVQPAAVRAYSPAPLRAHLTDVVELIRALKRTTADSLIRLEGPLLEIAFSFRPSIATLKGYPTDDALVGCYVLGKTLGRSADLKVKNETLFYTSAADLAYME
ncbi:hypothetical protein EVAR_64013_1 [Eumeta japonica]|uniref:Uncharacterized protein n=1 Tax=Eumeta variegata TaxID=151549 RepID=A0A4C1YYP8_EUMVA|nr:hypothetical protein EVAR_92944_1 [Eumeta japonica]GBP58821.1 hypothetical protein EVAR_84016_1 [Eumeta japonica]GBP81446.1 hypothetical protein EVAR_64013_1 [Eumeta japonica]